MIECICFYMTNSCFLFPENYLKVSFAYLSYSTPPKFNLLPLAVTFSKVALIELLLPLEVNLGLSSPEYLMFL